MSESWFVVLLFVLTGGMFHLWSGEAFFKVPRLSALAFLSETQHSVTQVAGGERAESSESEYSDHAKKSESRSKPAVNRSGVTAKESRRCSRS